MCIFLYFLGIFGVFFRDLGGEVFLVFLGIFWVLWGDFLGAFLGIQGVFSGTPGVLLGGIPGVFLGTSVDNSATRGQLDTACGESHAFRNYFRIPLTLLYRGTNKYKGLLLLVLGGEINPNPRCFYRTGVKDSKDKQHCSACAL